MPFVSQIQRLSDYSLFSPSTPIVIDNGGSYFRIGWAGETDPRVIFRNIVQRPRHKTTGETVTIVGDHDPALPKYFDCTRSGPRSAFDCNVVYQFEIMEYILRLWLRSFGCRRITGSARKAAIKEKQGQRLREMAEAKRSSRINELENELHGLEFLLKQLEQVEEDDRPSFLSKTGYVSKHEIESAVVRVTQSLRKAKEQDAPFNNSRFRSR